MQHSAEVPDLTESKQYHHFLLFDFTREIYGSKKGSYNSLSKSRLLFFGKVSYERLGTNVGYCHPIVTTIMPIHSTIQKKCALITKTYVNK